MKDILSYLLYMIPGFLFTGLIVFIHELGHFFAARSLGAEVESLGFGFGPVLLTIKGRKTDFRISLIPFGGYCRIKGAEDLTVALENNRNTISNSEQGSFFAISPWRKFLIFLAGPLTNLLLAFLFMIAVSALPVERLSHKAIAAPASDYPSLFPDFPEVSGIEKGDLILSSGNTVFSDWEDFSAFLSSRSYSEVTLKVLRDEKEVETTIKSYDIGDNKSYGIVNLEEPIIGRSESPLFLEGDRVVSVNSIPIEYSYDIYEIEGDSFTFLLKNQDRERTVEWEGRSFPFAWKAELKIAPDSQTPISTGISKVLTLAKKTTLAIMKLLSFHFSEALEVISGPFTSASTMGRISTLAFATSSVSGIRTLLYLFAIVSISICIGNLIPVPTFDGGQMIICIAEMIVGRPLKPKTYLILHIGGFVFAWIIIILMNAWGLIEKFL